MTSLILDAGAFIAVERGDRDMVAILKAAQIRSLPLRSNGGVVAEVWRGGSGRQVTLARLLNAVEVMSVNDDLGRAAGVLTRDAGGGSAVDAIVVASARDGDHIVTSDHDDIRALINSSGRSIGIVTC